MVHGEHGSRSLVWLKETAVVLFGMPDKPPWRVIGEVGNLEALANRED